MAVYEEWLRDESSDLAELVHRGFAMLQQLSDLGALGTGANGA